MISFINRKEKEIKKKNPPTLCEKVIAQTCSIIN